MLLPDERMSTEQPIVICHVMSRDEGFEETARLLFELIKRTAELHPGRRRALFFQVEGHRDRRGVFDRDALKLIWDFIPGALGPYLIAFRTPLAWVRTQRPQNNDVPSALDVPLLPKSAERAAAVATEIAAQRNVFEMQQRGNTKE
jgi:hypothetical protein